MSQKYYVILGLLMFISVSFLIIGCRRGINVKTNREIVELSNFQALKGKHCESSAMLNALHYQNVIISESMINGLGSSISFYLADSQFPFLGTRNITLKENFAGVTGIKVQEIPGKTSQEAYDNVKAVLKKGIPVVLRVNMRYLPYLWGGEYGSKYMSFGWHFVTLVKLDETTGKAWVTDTEHGLKEVRIPDLMKARSNYEGEYKAANYAHYFVEPSILKLDYKKALKTSLQTVINEFTMPGGALERLAKLPDKTMNIEKLVPNKFMVKPLLDFWYGCIETNGTGGCGFRNFYRDYLLEVGQKLKNDRIIATATDLDNDCRRWSTLASKYKSLAQEIGKYANDKSRREGLYREAAQKAKEVYKSEVDMVKSLESLYQAL